MADNNRRDFLKGAGAVGAATTLPLSLVELAFADPAQNFTFAYISDSHIQHTSGAKFVRNESLIMLLKQEIKRIDDFRENLDTVYDPSGEPTVHREEITDRSSCRFLTLTTDSTS